MTASNKTYNLSMARPLDNTPITVTIDINGKIQGITMTRQSKEKSPWQPGETESLLGMISLMARVAPTEDKHELYTFLEKLSHPDFKGKSCCQVHSAKESNAVPTQHLQPQVIEVSHEQLDEFLQNPKAFIEKMGLGNKATSTAAKPTVSMSHKTAQLATETEEESINDIISQAKALGYKITVEKIVPELSLFEQFKARNVKLQSSGVVAVTTDLSQSENMALVQDAMGRGLGFSVVNISKVPQDLLDLVA